MRSKKLCIFLFFLLIGTIAQAQTPEVHNSENLAGTNEKVQDFNQRTSLGKLEENPLPSLQQPMVSGPVGLETMKDVLPTEQLIGRITPEVFKELADIERANVFLRLQIQREELKKGLEELQAAHRKRRMDEVSEREKIIQERIQWWQEQEAIRSEIEEKKAQASALEQQILEAEAMRKQMRQKALAAAEGIGSFSLSELYEVLDIRGISGDLTARLKPVSSENVISVKEGDRLSSGHLITKITPVKVVSDFNGVESEISINFVYSGETQD